MAGEKKGKAYEALVYVALQDLVDAKKLAGPLHWNITPKGMSIEPDFMTGSDSDVPQTILLLSHSNSAGDSHKKFWRNLGELVEAKTVLPDIPRVYCLTFGIIKADLELIQQHAFDQFVWVRQATHPWADDLDVFVSACVPSFPKGKDVQTSFMRDELKKSPSKVKEAYKKLKSLLETMHKAKSAALDKMWLDHRSRVMPAVPGARDTAIRRGASKLFLFPDHDEAYFCFRSGQRFKSSVENLLAIGLVERRPGGFFPAKDADILSCCRLLGRDELSKLFSPMAITAGFRLQASKIKDLALLPVYVAWCMSNLSSLKASYGMKSALLAQHSNPCSGISVPKGCCPPTHVWIMDAVGAIVRASSGKTQSFGLSSFISHRLGKSQKVGALYIGDWCGRFMTGFLTRREGFNAPPEAVDFLAEALADVVSSIPSFCVSPEAVLEQYISKEFESVYLAHRGFEPLWGVISGSIGAAKKVRIRTCYAEAAGLSGGGGSCTVAQANHTLINWQSCSDAGRDHKKKELCGRAIGLRYHWNGKAFVRRPGIKKMILVLDGTWRQADLNALLRSGWDEIYYPDEMGLLAKEIV